MVLIDDVGKLQLQKERIFELQIKPYWNPFEILIDISKF